MRIQSRIRPKPLTRPIYARDRPPQCDASTRRHVQAIDVPAADNGASAAKWWHEGSEARANPPREITTPPRARREHGGVLLCTHPSARQPGRRGPRPDRRAPRSTGTAARGMHLGGDGDEPVRSRSPADSDLGIVADDVWRLTACAKRSRFAGAAAGTEPSDHLRSADSDARFQMRAGGRVHDLDGKVLLAGAATRRHHDPPRGSSRGRALPRAKHITQSGTVARPHR